MAECELDFRITTDTPYLALTGKLWSVYCEDLGENWPRYNGTALYYYVHHAFMYDGNKFRKNLLTVPEQYNGVSKAFKQCVLDDNKSSRRADVYANTADSRFAPNQRETSLQNNTVSHSLGANVESALCKYFT